MPVYRGDDDSLLHYDALGEDAAAVLVVLAGGAARHPEYLGDLAGLSARRRLIVPHLRGVGGSAAAPLDALGSWWQQAADLDRLRGHLGLDRWTLAAHSAGTRLAVAYAARFPDAVAGLLLITPPASYLVNVPSDAPALAERRAGETAFDAAIAARDAGPDIGSEDTFNAWQQAIAPLGYAVWNDVSRTHASSGWWALDAARAFLDEEPPADLVERLGQVLAPTLVLAGGSDAITGAAPVLAIADLFPHGRAETISDSGHYPWVEQPAAFRHAVDPFLAALP